ncbi:YkvA family protein [Barnesiella viscericola]|uniref:YkvA family protein n=1 Tax=Barnesiella viscericola TaxID=397865 RepID=UPI0025A4B48B|nr:YkvA family protein [Barnesiella viscericola]MDM8269704.1 YkvA family protein [Barnesiella viscericola]
MFTIICITILAYMIMGKDIKRLLARVKNVDWRDKINRIYIKLQPYALKAGRVAARPLLQFYYVMKDEKTSTLDRVLIYAAIIYTISPVSLIPSAVFKFIGILDEGAAVLYVYKKIKGKITPEINAQVDETLDQWFGTRYEMVRE